MRRLLLLTIPALFFAAAGLHSQDISCTPPSLFQSNIVPTSSIATPQIPLRRSTRFASLRCFSGRHRRVWPAAKRDGSTSRYLRESPKSI